jgi:hypothetical protein
MVTLVEFEDELYFTGPELTDAMVAAAEASFGYRLPASYVEVLRVRNGGTPVRRCFRTEFVTAWAPNYFAIDGLLGIGGVWGIEKSAYLIKEWDYPDIGVVFCATSADGYDAVMLDYRSGAPEPSVSYIDEDRVARVIAPTFSDFVARLETVGAIQAE